MPELNEGASVSAPPPQDDPPPDQPKKEPVTLRISVFFDGTGNNRGNIQERKSGGASYQVIKRQNPPEKDASKGIGSSVASFEADFSNVALMEETFKESSGADYSASVYVEGVGTHDLQQATEKYKNEMALYQQQMEVLNKGWVVQPNGFVYVPEQPKIKVDSELTKAFALGSSGLHAKINAGVRKVLEAYGDIIKENKLEADKKEIKKIYIDVFGFSRGAATARSFIHHLSSGTRMVYQTVTTKNRGTRSRATKVPYPELIKRMVNEESLSVNSDALQIKFAGLFDTVSSHFNALSSDVKKLNLDAVSKAEKVYHLCASEEHRMCFSLTDIRSAIKAGKGEEYYLPGVHSDIGGGYREEGVEEENHTLMNVDDPVMFGLNFSSVGINLEQFADMIEREGWYRNASGHASDCHKNWQIRTHKATNVYVGNPFVYAKPVEYTNLVEAHRCKISSDYRYIALQLMVEASENEGLSFFHDLKKNYKVPSDLCKVDSALRDYLISSGGNSKPEDWFSKSTVDIGGQFDFESLRNKYLHYSSHIKMGYWPRFKDGKRYREIYHG